LPPLSVMMALRKQKGQGYDANDLKLEMTADDWKALAAYESVLRAAYALRTSVLVAAVALVCNVPQLAFSTDTSIRRGDAITATVLVLVIVSLTVLWLGSLSLEKIRLSGLVDFLVMTVLGVGLAFAAATAFGVYRLTALRSESSDGFWIVVAIPFALIALFDLAKTGIWVCRALGQVEPPEITNRLTEALKYLE
jgi:hypothetical protein